MHKNTKDITGQRFGNLVVKEFAYTTHTSGAYWLCDCDCGNSKVICGASLRRGRSTCCGCHNSENIIGKKFNRLTVLGLDAIIDNRRHLLCKCDCGNTAIVARNKLVTGHTRSCGCLQIEKIVTFNYKHGMARTPTHNSYSSMIQRCYDKGNNSYPNYGGRGIKVCEEWLGDLGFNNFYASMKERPTNTTLDRIDNNGNYSPENCRWSTKETQEKNKRSTYNIEYKGEIKCLSDWAKIFNRSYVTIKYRLEHGWSVEDAFTAPPYTKHYKRKINYGEKMETKEAFMARCTNNLISNGKSERQANTACGIAWDRLKKSEGARRSDFIRGVRDDGIDVSDALILAGLAYMWLSDNSESYDNRESYGQSTSDIDVNSDYTNSYSSLNSEDFNSSSSSSDYSSSSYDTSD